MAHRFERVPYLKLNSKIGSSTPRSPKCRAIEVLRDAVSTLPME
jgi:hypothetical protein